MLTAILKFKLIKISAIKKSASCKHRGCDSSMSAFQAG